jgi:hypothetical protein
MERQRVDLCRCVGGPRSVSRLFIYDDHHAMTTLGGIEFDGEYGIIPPRTAMEASWANTSLQVGAM